MAFLDALGATLLDRLARTLAALGDEPDDHEPREHRPGG